MSTPHAPQPTPPAAAPPIQLGAFDLLSPIGYGGGAQVWRGRHRAGGGLAAVKVMTGRPAQDPMFVAAFRREIQTIAGLDHPAIVLLLDWGEITEVAAQASRGRLIAGSPWLAMELATGGTLSQALGGLQAPWPLIREALDPLLDALAYAHARGIIHRDVKPDNVMAFDGPGARWRLTDFGIAHAVEEVGGEASTVLGTPGYMAPEQVRGEPREYGPWTDLYALGCLAYQMVWGRLPYPFPDAPRYIFAQLEAPAPRLPLPPGMPPGLDGWIHRLLERDPAARFRRAADAAWALSQLDGAGLPTAVSGALDTWAQLSTRQIPAHGPPVELFNAPTDRHDRFDIDDTTWPAMGAPGGPPIDAAPPLPTSWRRPTQPRPPATVEGGLSLYGLRTIPMVGREAERDHLWAALREVAESGRARAVVVQGVAGVGKSCLVEWICERAHEVGAATVMEGTLGDGDGPDDGLAAMLIRHFKCADLDRDAIRERLERSVSRLGVVARSEVDALVDLMEEGEPTSGGPGLRDPGARSAVLRRLLQLMGRERPVILWFDDADRWPESLAFAEDLLASRGSRDAPVLILATTRARFAEEPRGAPVASLLKRSGAELVRLGPLPDEEQTRLVRELLGLRGDLVETVVAWSSGIPLASVQLVGSWVQQGLLVPGDGGLRIQGDRQPTLPASLRRVWRARLDRLMAARSQTDRIALELGAALGHEVSGELWHEVCALVGIDPSVDLVESLVERRLARWKDGGWAFVHSGLRDLLVAAARKAGRWRDHHLACARAYAALGAGRRGHNNERIALHLVEGGQRERALEPLKGAVEERLTRGDFARARHLLDRCEQLLTLVGAGEDDLRRAPVWLLRARECQSRGAFDDAARWAKRAQRLAEGRGDEALIAGALLMRASVAFRVGRNEVSLTLYQEALARCEELEDGVAAGEALLGLGELARRQGDTRRAQSFYARALGRYQAEAFTSGMARTFQSMAAISQHDLDRALDFYRRAMGLHAQVGDRAQVQACLNGMADVDRRRGLLDQAEARYREVLAFYEATGAVSARVVRINLALVLLQRRRYSEAEAILSRVRLELEQGGQFDVLGGVHVELCLCAAARGDWPAFDGHLRQASALLDMTGAVDRDDAWPAHEAGILAARGGQPVRARRVWAVAARLWRVLGEQDKIAEIQGFIRQLPDAALSV